MVSFILIIGDTSSKKRQYLEEFSKEYEAQIVSLAEYKKKFLDDEFVMLNYLYADINNLLSNNKSVLFDVDNISKSERKEILDWLDSIITCNKIAIYIQSEKSLGLDIPDAKEGFSEIIKIMR